MGQEHVVGTLKNALKSGTVAHAMIFSGSRGVGKTTTARVVAKTLNCVKFPSEQSPCCECTFCVDIQEGRSLDVQEIDAASHTGVGDVREIINNIKYLPTSGKTKIYIVDEAHMLSASAFNALLKTLEEPPPHVLFILATTEVHKIPGTILSRCQRHEFKRLSAEQIKERLEHVTSKEGIGISPQACYLLAQEADGSIRDALSLLDHLIATYQITVPAGTQTLTEAEAAPLSISQGDITKALGITDRGAIKAALKSILHKDPKRCIEILMEQSSRGISPKRFAEDLLKTLRQALIIKTCGRDTVIELSGDEALELEKLAGDSSLQTLELLFKLMLTGAEEVNRSLYPGMALEAALIKLSLTGNVVPVDEILKKIESIAKKIEDPGEGGGEFSSEKEESKPANETPSHDVLPKQRDEVKTASVDHHDAPKPTGQEAQPQNTEDFCAFVRNENSMMALHLEEASSIEPRDSTMVLEFPSQAIHSKYFTGKTQRASLQEFAKRYFGRELKLVIEISAPRKDPRSNGPGDSAPPAEQKDRREYIEPGAELSSDPVVEYALDLFGGKIIKVKNSRKE